MNDGQVAVSTCPFCREQVYAGAFKCKHCSSVLVQVPEQFFRNSPSQSEITRGQNGHDTGLGILFFVMGCLGLLIIVANSDDDDIRNIVVGVWTLVSMPALAGALWIISSKKTALPLSYTTLAVSIVSILLSIGILMP